MRKLITILLLFICGISFSQSIVPRAGQANTVSDARLQAQLNLFIPRFSDTTNANVSKGIDSLGAIIFTYDVNNFWIRVGNPKHWQQGSGGGTVLPDGVYSGGQVAYSGTGYDYIVSAATYVLGGVIYNSPQDTVSLPNADPTFDRIDVIGLSSSGTAGSITGVPSANPQEPSVNPQTFIRRSIVTVVANTTQPPNIDQRILFDEGTGLPDEWTASSDGNTDYLDVSNPYHLTIDGFTTLINSDQRMYFVNNDTISTINRSSLIFFVNFTAPLPSDDNINIQLVLAGNPVSQLLPLTKYGVLRNATGFYQMGAIPFSEFGSGTIVFDEVDIVFTGNSPIPPYYVDYIQIQSGLSTIYTQPNSISSITTDQGVVLATTPNDNINIIGQHGIITAANGKNVIIDGSQFIRNDEYYFTPQPQSAISVDNYINITNVANQSGILHIEGKRGGVSGLAQIQDNTTVGSNGIYGHVYNNELNVLWPNAPLGSYTGFIIGKALSTYQAFGMGYMYDGATPSQNHFVYNFFGQGSTTTIPFSFGADTSFKIGLPFGTDSSFKLDVYAKSRFKDAYQTGYASSGARITDSTLLWKAAIDSIVSNAAGFNSNIGSGFRLAQSLTKNIKTLFSGYSLTWDSTTNTNALTLKIDTTLMATRAFAQSLAPGGVTGVTSVSGVNANGISFSISNPTTTPAITLSTSVTSGQLIYANSGALTGSTSLTWVNGTSRLGIGATGAAYLSLAPSTTSQASFNLGNAGTAPTSPQNADVWVAGNHILARLGGVTFQIDQQASTGVSSITGTANQVIASAATGAVTLSLPQSIATTSSPTFQTLTLSGAAATANAILTSHTDPAAAAGVFTNNGTRLAISFATTYKRLAVSNDVAPTTGQGLFGNGTDYTVGTYSALNNSVLVAASGTGVTFRTNSVVQTLSGTSVSMNINSGENAQWTLTATGSSLAITNPIAGRLYFVNVIQDGTGSRTITTYPAGTLWYSGTAPVLKTTAGASNLLAFYYNGSNYYGYDWGAGGGGGGFVNPMTTIGDIIYGGASGVATRLAGNTTATPKVYTSTGTGSVATAPTLSDVITSYQTSTTLDFPNTGAQSSSDLTVALTNAVVGDAVIVGSTVNPANSNWTGFVGTNGVVSIRFSNISAVAINPASATFKVTLIK